MWLVNTPSKHETLTQCWSNARPRLRRWPSIKPALVQRLAFAGLRSIARWSVKCWASVPVLASIHSALVSTSLWWECVHMAYTALMPFKCWPASYTMARHRTNARYTSTLAGCMLASIHSALVSTYAGGRACTWYTLPQCHLNAGQRHTQLRGARYRRIASYTDY